MHHDDVQVACALPSAPHQRRHRQCRRAAGSRRARQCHDRLHRRAGPRPSTTQTCPDHMQILVLTRTMVTHAMVNPWRQEPGTTRKTDSARWRTCAPHASGSARTPYAWTKATQRTKRRGLPWFAGTTQLAQVGIGILTWQGSVRQKQIGSWETCFS